MAKGLDNLVELLLEEIAYSGDQGFSLAQFISVVKKYNSSKKGEEDRALHAGPGFAGQDSALGPRAIESPPTPADLAFARRVWTWITPKPEFSVGPNKEWNNIGLDDLLALPEADPAPDSSSPTKDAPETSGRAPEDVTQGANPTPLRRPRLFVSEATRWMMISGHGIDYKRIPRLEWIALVGIASSKREGILQGELRALINQDKRSLPKRTDFLAQKGYIAKRTVLTKGFKTSKLWLTKFAPILLPGAGNNSTSALQDFDLSPETLTANIDPVPWCSRWTEKSIDYAALIQSIVAVASAFGVMRYNDLRLKLGARDSPWHMRVMARVCRRLVGFGVLSYVAAAMNNDRQVYKDCVKFIRDPTDEEWEMALATGKKTSKYSDQTLDKQPTSAVPTSRDAASGDGNTQSRGRQDLADIAALSAWAPEKPLSHTVYEAVSRAGLNGLSSPQISINTVGYSFRRYMYSNVTNLSTPGLQPDHLKQFQLTSDRVRIGKTEAFIFYAEHPAGSAEPTDVLAADNAAQGAAVEDLQETSAAQKLYGFAPVSEELFSQDPQATLSSLGRTVNQRQPRQWRKRESFITIDAPEPETRQGAQPLTPTMAVSPRGRKRRRVTFDEPEVEVAEVDAKNNELLEIENTAPRDSNRSRATRPSSEPQVEDGQNHSKPAERAPGVYIGDPNSLDPQPKGRGRRKKSLVIIFRSDALKDPRLLSGSEEVSGFVAVNKSPTTQMHDEIAEAGGDTSQVEPIVETREITQVAEDDECEDEESQDADSSHLLENDEEDEDNSSDDDMEVLAVPILSASYEGAIGELSLLPEENAIQFRLTAEDNEKEPMRIALDDLVGEPALRPKPTGEGMVLYISAKSGIGEAPWPYLFAVHNDEENVEAAKIFSKAIVAPRAKAEAEESTPGETTSRVGRPKGSKGGRKGRGKKSSGGYRCNTCGKVWKNDNGLKYHQTKAQNSCNPDYVPRQLEDRIKKSRERAVKSATRAPSVAVSPGAVGQAKRRLIAASGPKRAVGPRGYSSTHQLPSLARTFAQNKTRDPSILPSPQPLCASIPPTTAAAPKTTSSPHGAKSTPREDHISAIAEASPQRRIIVTAQQGTSVTNERGPYTDQDQLTTLTKPSSEGPGVSSTPNIHAQRTAHDATTAASPGAKTLAPATSLPRPPTASTSSGFIVVESASPSPSMQLQGQHHRQRSAYGTFSPGSETPYATVPRQSTEQDNTGFYGSLPPPLFQMPLPSKLARMNEVAVKKHQCSEIIRYLLDSIQGVFPGDKAMYYALLRIFLREFRNQTPPTYGHHQTALRHLQARNILKEVTYGFKDGVGRLVTCTLVAKPNVDPSGLLATVMKNKVQEAYPKLYIPPPFSPLEDELRQLEALDGPNSSYKIVPGKRRGNRPLSGEVEVLNAPFYANIQPIAEVDDEMGDVDQYRQDHASPSYAAFDPRWSYLPWNSNGGDETTEARSSSGALSTQLSSGARKGQERRPVPGKMRRKSGEISDSDIDPVLRKRPRLEEDTEFQGVGGHPAEERFSIHNAVTQHRLLSTRPRGGRRVLPAPASGRRSAGQHRFVHETDKYQALYGEGNPGLDSLPATFFTEKASKELGGPASSSLQFLEPNTHLDDEAEEETQEEDPISVPYTSGPHVESETVKVHSLADIIVLRDSGIQGVWPDLPATFFEKQDQTSFTMRGWMPSNALLFHDSLPQSVEEMLMRLPGRQKANNGLGPGFAEFCRLVNGCERWEQSSLGQTLLCRGTIAPDHIFINLSCPPLALGATPTGFLWLPENRFSLETLPYRDLALAAESSDDEGGSRTKSTGERAPIRRGRGKPGRPRGSGLSRGVSRIVQSQQPTAAQSRAVSAPVFRRSRLRVQVYDRHREQISYPMEPSDYIPLSETVDEDADCGEEDYRIAAFVVVSTLLGGINQSVDWGLILRLFPDSNLSALKKFWLSIRKERGKHISKLIEKFQHAYLAAYEKGEIPPIDYDNAVSYDWRWLVDWTLRLEVHEAPQLPSNRNALDEEYSSEDGIHARPDWRERYFHVQRSVWNRFQDSTSEAAAVAMRAAPRRPLDDLTLTRSWLRALSCTSNDRYTPDHIRQKVAGLRSYDEEDIIELLKPATRELQSNRVLCRTNAHALSHKRPWRLHDFYEKHLVKTSQEDMIHAACAFKAGLDERFRRNESFIVPYFTDDGTYMALMNLQAHGRVKVESLNLPDVPFGFEEGNYETRQFKQNYHRFNLAATPTDRYLYNEDIEILHTSREVPMPGEGPDGELPIWCDFFGVADRQRWFRLLGGVLFMFATRGSIDAKYCSEAIAPLTEVFEVEMIMGWAWQTGLLQEMTPGSGTGSVTEWWWLALGKQAGDTP